MQIDQLGALKFAKTASHIYGYYSTIGIHYSVYDNLNINKVFNICEAAARFKMNTNTKTPITLKTHTHFRLKCYPI